jgi:hypothetical protein
MANKAAFLALGMGLCLLALAACKTVPPSQALRKAVVAADSIALYQVDGYPTPPAEQRADGQYLHGYAVTGQQPITPLQMADIKLALLDKATFDTAAVKSCPMVAQMALGLWEKGKPSMTLVLSPAPCGKALLLDAKPDDQPLYMELVPGNRLEGLVFGFGK